MFGLQKKFFYKSDIHLDIEGKLRENAFHSNTSKLKHFHKRTLKRV